MAIGACDPCGCVFEECECSERGESFFDEVHEPRRCLWTPSGQLYLVGQWSSKPSFKMQP